MEQVKHRRTLSWRDIDLVEKTWTKEAGGGKSVQQKFNWDDVDDVADLAKELQMLRRGMVMLLMKGYDIHEVDEQVGVLWVKDHG